MKSITENLLDAMEAETSRLSTFMLRKERRDMIRALRVAVGAMEPCCYPDRGNRLHPCHIEPLALIQDILRGEK